MYSRKFTHERRLEAEEALGKPLTYYKTDYIRSCVDHIESITVRDDKRRVIDLARPLAPDEHAFIENERILSALDYTHWAENFHHIRDVESLALVLMRQNRYQQVLTLAQGELEEARKPVLIQLLKARQGGGTTDTTSKILHRMLFIPNTASVIASSDPEKSWKLSEMLSRSLPLQPWWLIPPGLREFSSGETFLECLPRNSYVSIQHGTQGTGIARGDTINAYHLSELPDFKDQDLIVDASIFGAWHPTPMHFGVMESTANGRDDWWHKRWLTNNELWPKQLCLERPLFLPYYVSPEIYPTLTWLDTIPIPRNWEPNELTKEHVRKAQEYARSDPFLQTVLGRDYSMPRATQWWYEYSYGEALRKDKLGRFLSEYPSSAHEAFQSKSKSVFPIQLIQSYEVKVPLPVGVFKLSGSELPGHLAANADEILDQTRLYVPWKHSTGDLNWTLTPVKFPGYSSVNSHQNTLWVWEYPLDNVDYCVSLDVGEGVGRDRCVANVLRKGTVDRPAGQVACFTSDNMAGTEMWPIVLLLLSYYSTWNGFKNQLGRPLFSPETNWDHGAALLEVRKRGWSRICLDRSSSKRDQDSTKIAKLGFYTNTATRKLLIDWLMTVLKGHYIELNSPWTIDEMRDFVIVETETSARITYKIEHDKHKHDDELFALGIGIVTLHDLDVYRGQTPQWRAAMKKKLELITFATFREGNPENYFDAGDLEPAVERRKGVMYPMKLINGELK